MKRTAKIKKSLILAVFGAAVFFAARSSAFFSGFSQKELDFENSSKSGWLNDNGFSSRIKFSGNTVEEFLAENNIKLGEFDRIVPDKNEKIYSGGNILIERAIKISIEVDGKNQEKYFLAKNTAEALHQAGVVLSRLDKTSVPLENSLFFGEKIVVTRINEEEKIIPEEIDFKTIVKKDAKLGWREKKVEQAGVKGIKEVKYKITYKNGKEVSRIMLSKEITREPVEQIETQGTYMKLGNSQKGQGTWYSYQGGMYAASLTIPRGGFAKVTNTANGKSVVVEINDSGPYGKGRIIDLDKMAFQKIAPLGAGVIGVKVEEVLN